MPGRFHFPRALPIRRPSLCSLPDDEWCSLLADARLRFTNPWLRRQWSKPIEPLPWVVGAREYDEAMLDFSTIVPVSVAIIGIFGALIASFVTKRHQLEHQQREAMMKPSEEYARKTLEALAALRYVTPPPLRVHPEVPHRNEFLLTDKEERAKRIVRCEQAIDAVRITRPHIRLVFHPKSAVAELARRVLEGLRKCLETVAEYYYRADMAEASEAWRAMQGREMRESYISARKALYTDLDELFVRIASRLTKPLRKYWLFRKA